MILRTQLGVILFVTVLAQSQARGEDDLALIELQQNAVRQASQAIAPCVVQIETLGGLERVGRTVIASGPTTGLIVSEDGYVVSSAFNFIQEPDSILVSLSTGERSSAKIVARDRSRMVVLLKLNDVPNSLPTPDFADIETLRPGQTTIALGKTFSKTDVNLSVGILSATERIWGRAVQTDANVSPANYGGPLIDLEGRVIGLLVPLSPTDSSEVGGAEYYDSGIGFAVPLAGALSPERFDRWKSGEELLPGKLGITPPSDNRDLDPAAIIGVVKSKSPAEAVGMKAKDRIIQINDRTIERVSQMRHALGPLYAGERVAIRVLRGEEELEFEAELIGKLPPYQHAFFGILPAQVDENGVGIRYVYPGSPAAKLGVAVGDRISEFNGEPVVDSNELRQQLAQVEVGDEASFTWVSNGEPQSESITLDSLPESVPDHTAELVGKIDEADPAEKNVAPNDEEEDEAEEVEEEEEDQPSSGKQDFKLPEEANACTVYVPSSLSNLSSAGLLTFVPDPSDAMAVDGIIDHWKNICEAYGLVLIIPEPREKSRWSAPESQFIRKVIDRAIRQFSVDEQKIAIVGAKSGGTMAFLTGLRNRELVTGIAALDAVPPGDVSGLETEPLKRLSILMAQSVDSPVLSQMSKLAKTLRENRFPVVELDSPTATDSFDSEQADAIGRWLASLDRI